MHQEHKAGDKLYVDFAGKKLSITDKETGEIAAVEVFVAILGASQLTHVEAVASSRKTSFKSVKTPFIISVVYRQPSCRIT